MPSASLSWPTLLNSKPLVGLSTQQGVTSLSTEFEQGASRKRRRFSTAPVVVEQSIVLQHFNGEIDEVAIFHNFYDVILQGGTRWFQVNVYNSNEGYTLFDARCKGDEPPKVTNVSNVHSTAQFALEVINFMALDGATGWFVGDYGEAFTLSFSDELDRLVNEELEHSLGGLD